MDKLSELLRKRLDAEKLSVRNAAKMIGVSHSTVARAVNGETVEIDTLIKIANFLNIPVESILNISDSPDKVLEKIGMILNMEPELKETFVIIAEKINKRELDKKILSEIAAFAAYRLHQKVSVI